jgi:hypothetical protein
MNTIVKLSVAGALAMGYVSAHASIATPGSTSYTGDALLFAEVLNGSGAVVGSYAGDTGVTIASLIGKSVTSGTTYSDSNLQTLLSQASAGAASGDTVEWAVIGGNWSTQNNIGDQTPGNAQFTVTSSNLPVLDTKNGGNLVLWSQSLINTISLVNANANGASNVYATSSAAGGIWDSTKLSGNIYNLLQNGAATNVNGVGTAGALYYVTGNGIKDVVPTVIETVSLTSSGLEFTTPSVAAVPLPPAIWLLGGGLLGLAGISRRKTLAA